MEEIFEGVRSLLAHNETLGLPNHVGLSAAVAAAFNAVDWSNDWVTYTLNFHVLLWVLFLAVRTRAQPLVTLFAAVVGMDAMVRYTWASFSKREHYATNFVLVRLLWTTPLLFLGFVILVYSLVDATMSARRRTSRTYRFQRHLVPLTPRSAAAAAANAAKKPRKEDLIGAPH